LRLIWIKDPSASGADPSDMDLADRTLRLELSRLPQVIAAAPHRLLFLVGAANVLLAMAWWAAWLVDVRWKILGLPQAPLFGGWAHAFVMQYQVLPPFIFGFLLTVFPRWMGLPELTRWHFLPVGLGLLSGQALFLAGLFGAMHLVHLGVIHTLAGWIAGLAILLRLAWRDGGKTWHALSCAIALGFGLVGLALFAAFLHLDDARLAFASMKFGSFGLLLPVYVTVAHRMFPFFAANVVPGYAAWRPGWWLVAFWALTLAHLAFELAHAYASLWLVDLPLLVLGLQWLWRSWPRAAAPPLLRVLFAGFAWLPIALALYSLQSLWFCFDGDFVLGRAPAHALFVGFFGSLLVAMVTRVTQGHSGRPLQLGRIAGFAFVAIQVVAVLRIAAELLPDAPAWQAMAALGWLLAFLPWVLRSGVIYLTPRADRRPG
jgi:uncharacterized protein involved in response to NO